MKGMNKFVIHMNLCYMRYARCALRMLVEVHFCSHFVFRHSRLPFWCSKLHRICYAIFSPPIPFWISEAFWKYFLHLAGPFHFGFDSLPLHMLRCCLWYVFPFHHNLVGRWNWKHILTHILPKQTQHNQNYNKFISLAFMTRWATHLIVDSCHSVLSCGLACSVQCVAMCSRTIYR